jgi:hypothetical protein
MAKGFISEQMRSSRILSHGKIASLESAFSLHGEIPFSLFIVPTDDPTETAPVLIDCKLYQDDDSSDCPFALNCWNEAAVVEIADSAIDLTKYDLYWGAGDNAEES